MRRSGDPGADFLEGVKSELVSRLACRPWKNISTEETVCAVAQLITEKVEVFDELLPAQGGLP